MRISKPILAPYPTKKQKLSDFASSMLLASSLVLFLPLSLVADAVVSSSLSSNSPSALNQSPQPASAPVSSLSSELPPSRGLASQPINPTAQTRATAMNRFKQVENISYILSFALSADQPQFSGKSTLQFELKPKADQNSNTLLIDFEGGTLQSLTINGRAISDLQDPDRYDGHHISIQLDELLAPSKTPKAPKNLNKIEIAFTHPYSTNGNGLYRFKDPHDHRTYLYSNFEPYSAHQMFPCLDQPDLKATYQLSVDAPKEWTVISNMPEKSKTKLGAQQGQVGQVAQFERWEFPTSPRFSTYVFALHAGPFAMWSHPRSNVKKDSLFESESSPNIPLRLFSRQSLAKYVDSSEWFKVTEFGLDFYGIQFGYPYPFGKYDQIIVPDFNAGAMENVGAVTFSEKFVHRTRVTLNERRRRAKVILHEMAHMWFGNLVTLHWWNDLWLNESFATYISNWALSKSDLFPGIWTSFFVEAKQSAYEIDQMVTSHPIEVPIPDTESAEANFDAITYDKGASVLKQFSFLLGEDNFREGLQRYFEAFAFRNTTFDDFTLKLSEASGADHLFKWQHDWFRTQGLNSMKVNWECKEDPETQRSIISKFDILQTLPPAPAPSPSPSRSQENRLRTHRTQIGLLHFQKNRKPSLAQLVPTEHPLQVTYSGAQTSVPTALGLPCPDVVFPNQEDLDYVKTEFDPISLKNAQNHLGKIADPLMRLMIWHQLWERVVDGKLKPQEFAEIGLKELSHETNPEILSSTLEYLIHHSANEASILKFFPPTERNPYRLKLEGFIRKQLLSAPAASDEQLVWFRAALRAASGSPSSQKFLNDLLSQHQKLKGFPIDQERRWQIVQALARIGFKDLEKLIAKELSNDPTDLGQNKAISALASSPSSSLKNQWLARIFKKTITPSPAPTPAGESGVQFEEKLTLAKLRSAMVGFAALDQEEQIKSLVPVYFEELPKFAKMPEESEYVKALSLYMFPSLCEQEIVDRTSKLLEDYPHLPARVIKTLRAKLQEESRCIEIRKHALSLN